GSPGVLQLADSATELLARASELASARSAHENARRDGRSVFAEARAEAARPLLAECVQVTGKTLSLWRADHQEFVASVANDFRGRRSLDLLCERAQDGVSQVLPEFVVERAEARKIDERHLGRGRRQAGQISEERREVHEIREEGKPRLAISV